tara:strand:+ start:712 stop:1461 length:750 start_codon:yes stop_codon:yes gene_type:complete
MAVNVNTVYTTVLYILNKEQRGYITPQEFNSIAAQVQNEIFQSYFPDGNQLNRPNQNNQQNDTEFFNMFKDTAYKLYPFEQDIAFTYVGGNTAWQNNTANVIYKLGQIISTYNTTNVNNPRLDSITQLTSKKDFELISRSKLTAPTNQYPICYTTNNASSLIIRVSPKPDILTINCLTVPTNPIWGFQVGGVGQYVYLPGTSTDFELDVSEQTNIITQVLKYCGIIINDPTIIQTAEQEAMSVSQNEKS